MIGTAMGKPVVIIYKYICIDIYIYAILFYLFVLWTDNYIKQVQEHFTILCLTNWWHFWHLDWRSSRPKCLGILFKCDLNSACKLDWSTTSLHTSVNFLGMTISLGHDGVISMCTFQKSENLFLYILPHSSHHLGLTKSLVFGLLLMYYLQNTIVPDLSNMMHLLFRILIAHGHQNTDLHSLFLEAMTLSKCPRESYNIIINTGV